MDMATTTAVTKDKAKGKVRAKDRRRASNKHAANNTGTGRVIVPAIKVADRGMEPAAGRSKAKAKRNSVRAGSALDRAEMERLGAGELLVAEDA